MAVYMLRSKRGSRVKIGVAWHPAARWATSGYSGMIPMRILWNAWQPAEKWLHKRFSADQCGAEIFRFNPEMLSVDIPLSLHSELPATHMGVSPSMFDAWRKTAKAHQDWARNMSIAEYRAIATEEWRKEQREKQSQARQRRRYENTPERNSTEGERT